MVRKFSDGGTEFQTFTFTFVAILITLYTVPVCDTGPKWCTFDIYGISVCSDNFLQVDIYYGQLKSEEVEQKQAYDTISFLSK